jgi:HPt (histidine-containing phosphotransfer) domain-containing protein
MSDAINSIARLQHDYREMQQADRQAWYDAHASMGVTADYRKALAAFVAQQTADLKAFKAQLEAFRKEVSDEQKSLKGSVKTGNNGYAKRVTADESAAATEKCKNEKSNERQRICLRRALRTDDPNAKGWIQR